MPLGTRAPKELLHHQPAFIGYAGSVFPHTCREEVRGLRGSRLLDRRPPHSRCPAVPGPISFTRAILMALNSSVLSLCIDHLSCGTAGGLRQRHSSAASPVARPASALAWNPTAEPPGTRAAAGRLLPRYCSHILLPRALLTAAPDDCGPPGPGPVPSPSCNHSGFGTPPPHRPASDLMKRQASLFGSQPRRPSCICSGLEPHCRTSRYARRGRTPFTEVLLSHTAAACTAHGGP
ncbi:hypothetical protein QFZ58_006628 [Streptomyces sp. B1I3]|nr:hypothetical protein [Streptomyces sp. B1I3]